MVIIERGDVWWAGLAQPIGSGPGYRRPVVIVSADSFNRSRIKTVVVALISSNMALAEAPGNVPLASAAAGLGRDSVINVSQVATLDKRQLDEQVGRLPIDVLDRLDVGLRLALHLA